jgi:hypothetical protein
MKKIDIVLIIIVGALIIVGAKSVVPVFSINLFLRIIVGILIFCLFLYKQIKPHRNAMFSKNQKWFFCIELVFDLLFKNLKIKSLKLGDTLSIDSTALAVLSILIILLIL